MSAVVTIPDPENQVGEYATLTFEVPKGNGYDIDEKDRLIIKTSAWAGDRIAIFREWHHVVITPDRGPDGRFTKRGA